MSSSKPPHRSTGKRYSYENQQEDRSINQIEDAFHGWPVDRFARDLGEDVVVRICENGNPTGLSFFAQCKSVENIAQHMPIRNSNEIHYPIDVSHLRQWEKTATPVVLIIWDVTTRKGWWRDIESIAKELSTNNPGWGDQTTVTVTVPLENSTDARGRIRLRQRIAALATASKSVTISFSCEFPSTPEGQEAAEGLRRALEHGDIQRVDRNFLTQFEISEPAKWVHADEDGDIIPDWIEIESAPGSDKIFCSLEAIGSERTERIWLELLPVKGGSSSVTLSNAHQKRTLARVNVQLHRHAEREVKVQFHLTYEFPGKEVDETLELVRFLLAAKQGGLVQLRGPKGEPLVLPRKFPCNDHFTIEHLTTWEQALTRLSFIQSRTLGVGFFDVSQLRDEDLHTIWTIHSIMLAGKKVGSLSFSFRPSAFPVDIDTSDLTLRTVGPNWSLLGLAIPQGRIEARFLDNQFRDAITNAEMRASGQQIALAKLPVEYTYLDWARGASGAFVVASEEPEGDQQ